MMKALQRDLAFSCCTWWKHFKGEDIFYILRFCFDWLWI